MPAIREHDIYFNEIDDDDGMPPLVDNPNTSMTFTFFTDMTPITALSIDPTAPSESTWDNPLPSSPLDSTETPECPAPTQTVDRVSHGKKRDASYIPRPPNAFILFRSSFIRSQQVPENVEGNHSTLSKIIGKYWKTLPREEREIWEAKALVAQAEHRKRYPDWRFRPGANALAKLKVKDGPGLTNRKRNNHVSKKNRGDSESKKKNKSKDERCSVIADLLVEGKTGAELESALRNWENGIGRDVGVSNIGVSHKGEDDGRWSEALPTIMAVDHTQIEPAQSPKDLYHPNHCTQVNMDVNYDSSATSESRCKTPPDDRFKVPLTAMFKRSLSAPAMPFAAPGDILGHVRHNSVSSNFSDVLSDPPSSPPSLCSPTSYVSERYEEPSVAIYGDSTGQLSPLVLPSGLGDASPARWNNHYNLLGTSSPIASSPSSSSSSPSDCPGLSYAHSPSISPVDMSFGNYTFPSPTLAVLTATKPENISAGLDYPISYDTQCYSSSYSALKGWADGSCPCPCGSFDTSLESQTQTQTQSHSHSQVHSQPFTQPHVFINQHTTSAPPTMYEYEWSDVNHHNHDTMRAGHTSSHEFHNNANIEFGSSYFHSIHHAGPGAFGF